MVWSFITIIQKKTNKKKEPGTYITSVDLKNIIARKSVNPRGYDRITFYKPQNEMVYFGDLYTWINFFFFLSSQ